MTKLAMPFPCDIKARKSDQHALHESFLLRFVLHSWEQVLSGGLFFGFNIDVNLRFRLPV